MLTWLVWVVLFIVSNLQYLMKTKIWLSLEPGRRQNPLNCQIICELWSKTENKSFELTLMSRKLAHICLRMLEILSQRVSNFKTLQGSIGYAWYVRIFQFFSVHIMHFITFSNHNLFIHLTWKKNSCKPWHRKHYVGFNLCFCLCT